MIWIGLNLNYKRRREWGEFIYKYNKRKIGTEYEVKAASFLEENGYRIIDKNFYSSHSEIDIIATDMDYIVFIEVKYRKNDIKGNPLEAVNYRKRNRIIKGAKYYLHKNFYNQNVAVRFDVVSIVGDEIKLIKDAFWLN